MGQRVWAAGGIGKRIDALDATGCIDGRNGCAVTLRSAGGGGRGALALRRGAGGALAAGVCVLALSAAHSGDDRVSPPLS